MINRTTTGPAESAPCWRNLHGGALSAAALAGQNSILDSAIPANCQGHQSQTSGASRPLFAVRLEIASERNTPRHDQHVYQNLGAFLPMRGRSPRPKRWAKSR